MSYLGNSPDSIELRKAARLMKISLAVATATLVVAVIAAVPVIVSWFD